MPQTAARSADARWRSPERPAQRTVERWGVQIAGMLVTLAVALMASPLRAEVAEASGRDDAAFDVMNLLAQNGLHDLKHESWNAYGQFTFISSWKMPFSARYSGPNSLSTDSEQSFTGSATLYLGARLWPGAEAYLVPEVISLRALSGLKGLGGAIQNFELQKTGSETPQLYRARAYLQQTFDLGGHPIEKTSDPMQLGTVVDSRRLVLRLGNFSVIDFFDKNTFAGDLRQQFFNMAFMTYAAYDFEADARGYSWGGVAEFYYDDWAFRFARMAPPAQPNSLPLEFRFDRYYGDQAEIEHDHKIAGLEGAVRLLMYRNRAKTGRFDDAIAAYRSDPAKNAAACDNYGSTNANAPDLCWARKTNEKMGVGINVEQHLTEDIGVFLRGMVSDGQSEVYAFTSTDRSLAFGALAKGSLWHRPLDVTGVGIGLGWISKVHAEFLGMGGIDGFIGDGAIRRGTESVGEVFYSLNVASALWLSADYQHITNPAFNADRGPVDIFGARFHAEF